MKWIVGIDEVGRGPLAGPVCVCAVAMPENEYKRASWKLGAIMLTDSKKMSHARRVVWRMHALELKKKQILRIGVSMRSAAMIDRYGINACIKSCINTTLKQLKLDQKDCTVLLDGGLQAPVVYKKQRTIVKGDSKHKIISLAAVVAKVHRDTFMQRLHTFHAKYEWNQNKGYGTINHCNAIRMFGPSPFHRKSFISKVFFANRVY